MKSVLFIKFLCGISLLSLACQGCQTPSTTPTTPQKDWWQTAQFYQIYPRSFKDSNGDGIGDLRGITSKLDYLKEIGVTATWLSPIYKSPMADFGYDISDFFDIQDEYGNLADFDNLIQEANKKGLKVILDFVPNHSSDENIWFKKSVNRERGFEDFYVWHKGKVLANGTRVPPSNWLQAFRGSAWEWNDVRQEYYLHQFAVKQPDLNYRNPEVVAQMKRVLTYWLDRGVAGFRVDAVPWCFEANVDADGNYPDEPVSGSTDDKDNPGYLRHIYTQDQPETIDMVYQWRKLLDDYQRINGGDTRVLLIETYSSLDQVMLMYGNKTTQGAQIPFNFQFILNKDNSNAQKYVDIIKSWYDKMPPGKTPNWVMGNHDQRRVGSRYGKERIDTMNMIQMILPGVSITYMGEELGMLDGDITWEQSKDPAACNSNPDIFQESTRDPARTPFQWDDSTAAGFSTNTNTWLPVNPNYVTVNVEVERNNNKSHLNVYKAMVELRKTDTLKFGKVQYALVGNGVLVIRRFYKEKSYVLVANILSSADTVNLSANSKLGISGTLTCRIVSVDSIRQVGASVNTNALTLQPYEALVLES